eukprot:6965247-Lingulodinium_polyedra.AAC.1
MPSDVRRKHEVNIKHCIAAERQEFDVAKKKLEADPWVSNAVFPLPTEQVYRIIGSWLCDGS